MVFICKTCGQRFGRYIEIDGKKIDLGSRRRQCPICLPYKSAFSMARKERRCRKCNALIPPSSLRDGIKVKLYRRKYCLNCSPWGNRKFCGAYGKFVSSLNPEITNWKSRYSKEKRLELKRRAIEYLGGKCIRCGYNKNNAALCFHHKEGKKEFPIGGYITNWERIVEELKKCELLCQNCHHEIHYPNTKGEVA